MSKITLEQVLEADPSTKGGQALEVFVDYCGNDYESASKLLEAFDECYAGEFSSTREFGEDFLDQFGLLSDLPEIVTRYFDYEAYGRDLLIGGDYWESNGYYFRSY
jgi:antirestriction protein